MKRLLIVRRDNYFEIFRPSWRSSYTQAWIPVSGLRSLAYILSRTPARAHNIFAIFFASFLGRVAVYLYGYIIIGFFKGTPRPRRPDGNRRMTNKLL